MLARIRVRAALRRWKDAELLARRGLGLHPEEGELTVQRAFALHQMEKGDEAFKALLAAPEWIRAPEFALQSRLLRSPAVI